MGLTSSLLIVDDDPNILEAYQRKLQHALQVRTAEGPHLGLREIKEKGYTGSYSILAEFIKPLREEKRKEAVIRFETMPGGSEYFPV